MSLFTYYAETVHWLAGGGSVPDTFADDQDGAMAYGVVRRPQN